VRYPVVRVHRLNFAPGTPMETTLANRPAPPDRVMPAPVAAILRQEMMGIVEFGTARRAFQSIRMPNGTFLSIGGKTGTGDNRLESFDSAGMLLRSKVMSRTAAFVFVLGDRFYGTVIAYVPGEVAGQHSFTSALAVQIFRHLTPTFENLIQKDREAMSRRLARRMPAPGHPAPLAP